MRINCPKDVQLSFLPICSREQGDEGEEGKEGQERRVSKISSSGMLETDGRGEDESQSSCNVETLTKERFYSSFQRRVTAGWRRKAKRAKAMGGKAGNKALMNARPLVKAQEFPTLILLLVLVSNRPTLDHMLFPLVKEVSGTKGKTSRTIGQDRK